MSTQKVTTLTIALICCGANMPQELAKWGAPTGVVVLGFPFCFASWTEGGTIEWRLATLLANGLLWGGGLVVCPRLRFCRPDGLFAILLSGLHSQCGASQRNRATKAG